MSTNEFAIPVGGSATGLNYRLLGLLGMIGAPMLFVQVAARALLGEPETVNPIFQGVTGILYIGGWIGVAVAMRRRRATGDGAASRIVFVIQMFGLATALLVSFEELFGFDSTNGGLFYFLTDLSYPFSHTFMLVVGILVWRARVFSGPARIAPFAVAMILPLFFAVGLIFGTTVGAVYSSGFVAVALFILARGVSNKFSTSD